MIFYYLIAAGTIYLLIQSYLNYRSEKIEKQIKDQILFTSFKNRK
jgi:hypothetical protein